MSTTAIELCDEHEPESDLSLIYREIYALARATCRLTHEQADRLACWYCSTGGHIDETVIH